MVLREMTEKLARRNWRGAAMDLLIVVVGVFLGLQAQEWNQQRIDRVKEREYLARLATDFSEIGRDLDRCVKVYSRSVEAIKEISDAIESLRSAEPGPTSIGDALVQMTAGDIPAGRSTTFIEMLSSGELGLIRNVALRNALVSYDQLAQTNRELWQSLQAQSNAYMKPLYDNVKLSVDLGQDQISSIRDYDLEAMSQSPAFGSMLNVLAGTKGNVYELCLGQSTRAASVRQLLE